MILNFTKKGFLFSFKNKIVYINCKMDIHCWTINKDGTIYDPYFKEYDTIKKIRNLTDNQVYKSLEGIEKKKMWVKIWKKMIKPHIKNMKKKGMTKEEFFDIFYAKPMFGFCWLNSYTYHLKNKGSTFHIGKMGWIDKNGEPFWEYG